MVSWFRPRSSGAAFGLLLVIGWLVVPPAPAVAQPAGSQPEPQCAATGYLVESGEDTAALRGVLVEEPVHQLAGVPLESGQVWVVPDGSQPVVVLDAAGPVLPGGVVSVAIAGREFEVAREEFDEPRDRYVTNVSLPHLGGTVRSLGLSVVSGPCAVAVALSVDRSVWSTVVGGVSVGVSVLFGVLAVWVGRLRRGGWGRRFGFAAPLAVVAGIGQAGVLVEAGVVSPLGVVPWWPPVVGLGVAALLPLTRWRRHRSLAPVLMGRAELPPPGPPPAQAPLGGYRIDEPVARSELAGIYRATRVRAGGEPEIGERALLKVVLAERYGEPAARLGLEREARALSGWEHPNLLRLRETVSDLVGSGGPPTLVFEHVDGVPLQRLLAGGGSLSGPQVVSLVLGVLAGLQAVHGRELVHRDVRPENVWLTTDGRVLLAGFELACAGVEHPVAPEGVAPYASPEQRAGRVLDGRSDLWACGLLLGGLLTGQLPPRLDRGGFPDPLVAVLVRALAEDPAGRPASAAQFAAELRAAAEQAFGADWVSRGALAGALVSHAAIGAAAGGYTLAGGAAGAGAGLAAGGAGGVAGGVPAGAAGFGAAAPTAATPGLAGVASSGSPTVAGVAAPAAGAGTTAGTGATGPVGALVNAAVAVVAGAVVATGIVIVDPQPAQAQPVVITPDQAHVIFVRTMTEGWQDDFTHYAEDAEVGFGNLLDVDESLADGQPTGVEVGVAPGQYEYPAWFVASALIPFEDGSASVFVRFERVAVGEPWLMVGLSWSTEWLLPGPLLDGDGWLAPPPGVGQLLVDPAGLPQRYADWLARAEQDKQLGTDDVLTLRYDDTGMLVESTRDIPFSSFDRPEEASYEFETTVGELATELVPLVDGTVHVTFTSTTRETYYNSPDGRARSCTSRDFWLFWTDDDPPGNFRWLAWDLIVSVEAWIPVVDAVPPEPTPGPAPAPTATPTTAPTATPGPTPDPEADPEDDEPPTELELPPVDPTTVVIEDWWIDTDNKDGELC